MTMLALKNSNKKQVYNILNTLYIWFLVLGHLKLTLDQIFPTPYFKSFYAI